MTPTLDTRKPVDRLTLADLETFAVWEFAEDEEGIEGRDETWVRPCATRTLSRRISPYGVRAELATSGGERMLGAAWVTTAKGLEVDGIALFLDGAYAFVHRRDREFDDTVRRRLASQGITFPLAFRLSATLDGLPAEPAGSFE